MLDARLGDGSRVAICTSPAAPEVAIAIRRFGGRSFSANDLVRMGSLPAAALKTARTTLAARRNVLVSGGTGSGNRSNRSGQKLTTSFDFVPTYATRDYLKPPHR